MSKWKFGWIFPVLFWVSFQGFSQGNDLKIALDELDSLNSLVRAQQTRIDALQLKETIVILKQYGYPVSPFSGEIVEHHAMVLEFVPKHHQAAWVYHVILPAIKEGTVGRSNDFRPDPKVSEGLAVDADYFLAEEQSDGSMKYDGFGYDRGHLAPSADFRWNELALSESYFFSNITPQLPGFNREGWARIEDHLRAYVMRTENPLLVVTGGVLHDDLPVQERGVNPVSIPEWYYKVAVDPVAKKGIGFLVPHAEFLKSPDAYAVPVDSIEAVSGLDFYSLMEDQEEIEKSLDNTHWFPELGDNTAALDPTKLPRNTYNSTQALYQKGNNKRVNICGTVVDAQKTRKGHVLLKFDKVYPEAPFMVFIGKDNMVNFETNPEEEYDGACLCVKGKVEALGDTPTMFIENEKAIQSCAVLQ
jgi:endonuclease G